MKHTWLIALLAIACSEDLVAQERATLRFSTAILHVQSDSGLIRLRAELAVTDEQHAQGLQGRDQLASDAGMLFRLRDAIAANTPAITMYRTRIPLDIAFLDRSGTILDIKTMEPCTLESRSACPRYASAAAFHGVLEVNRGVFARHGIRVGHKVVQAATETCYSWALPDQPAAQDTASAWLVLRDTISIADWKRAYLHGPRLARHGWQQATWREHTTDSIRVVMNNGFVSLVFTLRNAPDTLTGFLDYTSDVALRDSTGVFRLARSVLRATARPLPCPAHGQRG